MVENKRLKILDVWYARASDRRLQQKVPNLPHHIRLRCSTSRFYGNSDNEFASVGRSCAFRGKQFLLRGEMPAFARSRAGFHTPSCPYPAKCQQRKIAAQR